MLSPFGIIGFDAYTKYYRRIRQNSHFFHGAVQFLISLKYYVFQSTQAASTCTITFFVFIPMKINIIYLFIYEKVGFICIDKSYEVN